MVEAAKIHIDWFRAGECPRASRKKRPAGAVQMNSEQLMAKEFHRRFWVFIRSSPGLVDEATRQLRIKLIREEQGEVEKGANDKNHVKIADAIDDVVIVI